MSDTLCMICGGFHSTSDCPEGDDSHGFIEAKPSKSASAFGKQVGGGHYKDMVIQPVDFIMANNIPYCEANAIKYICRHQSKNGKQDLEKAIHYLQMLIERQYP